MDNTTVPRKRDWWQLIRWALFGFLVLAMVYYIGPILVDHTSTPQKLVVYAFSTQEEVFSQGVFPAFERMWESESGNDLQIEGVFSPSGTLAGQINLGAPADVAVFSNANHVNWLKIGRQIEQNARPTVIGATPIVIVVRPGNPKGITEWADLAQPGLVLIHEDPRSSGLAEWAILAEYGTVYLESGDQTAAEAQLQAIWRNVRVLSPSARSALSLFELGAGDAYITYEQDAHLALARGVPLEIILPSQTIISRPVAIAVDENITQSEAGMVQAFMDFLVNEEGQEIFSHYYLRPENLESYDYPPISHPFTEEDLGGWTSAYSKLVENIWQTEIEPNLELETIPVELNPGK